MALTWLSSGPDEDHAAADSGTARSPVTAVATGSAVPSSAGTDCGSGFPAARSAARPAAARMEFTSILYGSVTIGGMPATVGVRLRRYYVAGILVLAPTALTLWVVWKLFTFFDDILGNQLRARGVSVVGLGFVLLNLVLLALGFAA